MKKALKIKYCDDNDLYYTISLVIQLFIIIILMGINQPSKPKSTNNENNDKDKKLKSKY